jgi:hypothetical protein
MISLVTVYENFTFKNPTTTLPIIIWGIYAGFVIAGILSYYNKNYLGAVVRALVKKGANSPENALTFEEAGISGGFLRRRAVFGDNALSKYVEIANSEECQYPAKKENAFVRGLRKFFGREQKNKYDAKKAKLYVLEEKRIQAELRYTEKGTTVLEITIGIVAAFVVAVAVTVCIPYILELVDSVITLYKNL